MYGTNLWLEDKYARLLSSRLDRFTVKGPHKINFRCPYCGDSKKSKFKARGYLFEVNGSLIYKCMNCSVGRTFSNFIKDLDPQLYREFRMELLREAGNCAPERTKVETPPPQDEPDASPLDGLRRVDYFAKGHPVREYVESRKIPQEIVDGLYYADRFMEWVNTKVEGKFDERQLRADEPRLVIPFVDGNGKVFAVTGRSFKKNSIKYITIKFDDQAKVFGMDRVDPSKRVYVVEGPIDSFFIDNSIAFAGSSGDLPDFEDMVVVLDNEPRNADIVRMMEKFIAQDRKVCIWPEGFGFKDINEAVMSGMSRDQVRSIIDSNTYQGLRAAVRMRSFKKA